MIKLLTLVTALLFALPVHVQAQETLEGYVPPPMFGGAPKKVIKPKKTVKPPVQKTNKQTKTTIRKKTQPSTEERTVVPLKKPPHPKEKFEQSSTVKEIGRVEKNKVNPGIEPIDLLKKQQKAKPKSQGIVKGPKTMPAYKKDGVESEVLFEPESNKTPDLLDRVQKNKKKQTVPIAVPEPMNISLEKPKETNSFELPKFNVLSDGSRKLNIIFPAKQETLNTQQINTLDNLIIPILKENKNSRIRLESYASPQDDSLSGDRRRALTRAMAIRNHVLDQDIEPNRLDVRSLGAQTDIQPMDRIEIFIVQ